MEMLQSAEPPLCRGLLTRYVILRLVRREATPPTALHRSLLQFWHVLGSGTAASRNTDTSIIRILLGAVIYKSESRFVTF